jgi:PAS domain S-box-containing protein
MPDSHRSIDPRTEGEQILKTIIDIVPECIKVLDEQGGLTMMNRAGLDMIQVDSLDQVKGQCIYPMITSEFRVEFMDLTKRVFQGESGTLMFEIVGRKGRQLWLETRAVPLRNKDNDITALLGVTRDVTENIRTERERDKLIADLQKALAEIKTLHGLLPICSSCKKIRDDKGSWTQIEVYIRKHSEAEFTHGLCQECAKTLYPKHFKKEE